MRESISLTIDLPPGSDLRCPVCAAAAVTASARQGVEDIADDCGCGWRHCRYVPGSLRVWFPCGCVVTGEPALAVAEAMTAAFTRRS